MKIVFPRVPFRYAVMTSNYWICIFLGNAIPIAKRIESSLVTVAKVSWKSLLYCCVYPLATTRALRLPSFPFATNLFCNTNRLPTTASPVVSAPNLGCGKIDKTSADIASIHLLHSGQPSACQTGNLTVKAKVPATPSSVERMLHLMYLGCHDRSLSNHPR